MTRFTVIPESQLFTILKIVFVSQVPLSGDVED